MTTETMTKTKAPDAMKNPPNSDKEWEAIEARHAKLMTKMNRICLKAKAGTQEDGMRFAIEVLKILEDAGADITSAVKGYTTVDGKHYNYRRGPQSRLLWRALDEFAIMHKPAQVGFAIVLTDFLGAVMDGSIPDPEVCYGVYKDKHLERLERWQLNEHGHPA